MKFFLFFLLLISSTHSLHAKNYSYLIGGGGEKKNRTLFDNHIKQFEYINGFTEATNQKIYFDGGHSNLEKNLKKSFPSTEKNNFKREDYFNFLEDLKNRIKSGEIKAGDQVMISMLTHGASRGYNEISHHISLKTDNQKTKIDLTTLEGSDTISLDMLKEVIDLTEKAGVKLALIDHSCFGGSSIKLAENTKNVCVISGTNPDMLNVLWVRQLSMGIFKDSMSTFNEHFPKSKNLEEVAIKMSKNVNMPVMPLNSIPKFLEITQKLSDIAGEYINPTTMDLSEVPECINVELLKKAFEGVFDGLEGGVYKQLPEYSDFMNALQNYEKTAKKRLEKMKKLKAAHESFNDTFLKNPLVDLLDPQFKTGDKNGFLFIKMDFSAEVKQMDFDAVLGAQGFSLEQIANIKQNYEKNMKEYAPKVKKLRDEMEKRESDTGLDEYMFSTSKITRAFNRLRAKMYEMNMNENESNPCREFKI